MGKSIDITGQKFGRLTAIAALGRKHGELEWKCLCECGETTFATSSHLRSGHTTSCGCYKSEIVKTVNLKHGLSRNPIRTTYSNMKTRCYNPKYELFHRYGGRGITVCQEWLGDNGFQNFYNWAVESGYGESKSLDRIDNDHGYSPSNCRWATPEEQSNNRSTNRIIEYNGESKTLAQWSKALNVPQTALLYKINCGTTIGDLMGGDA